MIFLILSSGKLFCSADRNHLCDFSKGQYEEQFCVIISIWTSGSGGNFILRHFLSKALAAPLFSGAEPFVQFWLKASLDSIL